MLSHCLRSLGSLLIIGWIATACSASAGPRAESAASPPSTAARQAAAPTEGPTPAGGGYWPTPLAPPANVHVGTINSTSDAGIFIALEKGYFEEEGLTVQLQNFQTSADMIAPLGTGQLDVATGANSVGLYNAAARGVPLRIVADKGSTPGPEWDYVALMVRKELVDTGQVRDYADLKGLTFARSTARGASAEVQTVRALAKGGLVYEDVQHTTMSFPDMITAFANRAIGAAIVIEPFVSRIESMGTAVRWKGNSEFYGDQQVAVIMYGSRLVQERQDIGRRWMIAYVRGLRDYNDAFGPKKQGRDEIVQILIKHTAVKDPTAYEVMRPAGLDPDGRLKLPSLYADLAYYEETGQLRERIDVAQVVDTSFQEHAVQQLGPYPR